MLFCSVVFVFNEPATTEIYTYLHTLSLHDALPIYAQYHAKREQKVAQERFQENQSAGLRGQNRFGFGLAQPAQHGDAAYAETQPTQKKYRQIGRAHV